MTTYLSNAFSPSMLPFPSNVQFQQITQKEFCETIDNANNIIGHVGTVDFVNKLCGTKLQVNRVSIKLAVGDTVYIIMLSFRLNEGQVLDFKDVKHLYDEGKVLLLKATVYKDILRDLAKCEGTCDQREYDYLAHLAGYTGRGD